MVPGAHPENVKVFVNKQPSHIIEAYIRNSKSPPSNGHIFLVHVGSTFHKKLMFIQSSCEGFLCHSLRNVWNEFYIGFKGNMGE